METSLTCQQFITRDGYWGSFEKLPSFVYDVGVLRRRSSEKGLQESLSRHKGKPTMNGAFKIDTSPERIESLLKDISKQAFVPKEKTFFSIGGRGYYENPTSDVLAFFLTPDEQHGFGALFLRAFLECLEAIDLADLDLSAATVSREVRIKGGEGRIDIYVRGEGWSLIIENKIRHWLANDFSAYAAYAKGQAKKSHHAILSPSRIADIPADWECVTYREYCNALRGLLPEVYFNSSLSKWKVLAHDFIVHLEEEIYGPSHIMTPEQIALVEKNLGSIDDAIKLRNAYRGYLGDELRSKMLIALPGQEFKSYLRGYGPECEGHNWAFGLEIRPQRNTEFIPLIWLTGLTSQQMELTVAEVLSNRPPKGTEAGWEYWESRSFTDHVSALDELLRLASALAACWRLNNIGGFAVSSG